MISESYRAKQYCCEDISKIENYDKAIADQDQIWEIHHKAEVLPCGRFSKGDLIKFSLYWNRPANELIYLRHDIHRSLHHKGNIYMLGRKLSSETKHKLSKAQLNNPTKSKRVYQFSKEGKLIAHFPSACEASRQTKVAQSSICCCCKGKLKSAGSFIWRYV